MCVCILYYICCCVRCYLIYKCDYECCVRWRLLLLFLLLPFSSAISAMMEYMYVITAVAKNGYNLKLSKKKKQPNINVFMYYVIISFDVSNAAMVFSFFFFSLKCNSSKHRATGDNNNTAGQAWYASNSQCCIVRMRTNINTVDHHNSKFINSFLLIHWHQQTNKQTHTPWTKSTGDDVDTINIHLCRVFGRAHTDTECLPINVQPYWVAVWPMQRKILRCILNHFYECIIIRRNEQ